MPNYSPHIENCHGINGIGDIGRRCHRLPEYDGIRHGPPPAVYSANAVITLTRTVGTCHGCGGEHELINGYCQVCRALGENEAQCLNATEIAARAQRGRENSQASAWRLRQQSETQARHVATLKAIKEYSDAHGFPPGLPQLQAPLGLASRAAVKARIDALARRGLVQYDPRKFRTLRITAKGMEALG